MKKLIYCAAALVTALFAGSCQQELLDTPAGENTVTYTVEVPGVATKAIADGKNVNRLFYEVYVTNAENVTNLDGATLLYKKDIAMVQSNEATSRANVTLNLVQNQFYTVLFWAQCGEANEGLYDVTDLKAVTYRNGVTVKANHEDYAAFYAVDCISDNTPRNKKVYLKRPFAQLNIGTLNTVDYSEDPYTVTMKQSKVTVKQVPTVFNVATSAVDGATDLTFTWESLELINDEQLVVNDKNYDYIAMNYMFAGENRTAKVEYELEAVMTTQGNVEVPADLAKSVVNVPLKENYRTNIVGNLLTNATEYEVIVDADWAGEENVGDASVTTAEGLVTALERAMPGVVAIIKLEDNIDLNGMVDANNAPVSLTIDPNKSVVLDLNGYTLSNTVNQTGAYGLIQNNGTLVITDTKGNGKISYCDNGNGGNWGSNTVWNNSIMTIEAGTIENNSSATVASNGYPHPIDNNGVLTINGGTVTNNANYSSMRIWCTTDDNTIVTINGGTFNGSIDFQTPSAAANKGTLTINGGTFNADSYTKTSVRLLGFGADVDEMNAYINGGVFNGEIALRNWSGSEFNSQVFFIKGGEFSEDPSDFLVSGYKSAMIDNSYIVIPVETAVASTKADLETVFSNGGTVILGDDIEFEKITSIEPGKEVYLNLNGKKITVNQNTQSNTLIYVKDGAKLIVDGNGIIDLGAVSTMAVFAPYGELVIENGTFIRDEVTVVTGKTTGLFMGAKTTASNVTINGGYFDAGYYNTDAAEIEELLAGTKTLDETADDIAKRGNSKDANKVRIALKDNISCVLNHAGYGSFKIYGGTFVGANPAWGDEGCMLPTTPNYLRPWSYYQGALLDGQTFNENGIVLPAGYTITKGATDEGVPTYTVTYNK